MIRILSTLPMLIALPAQADADAVATEVGSSLFTGDYLLQVVGSFFLVICALLAVMLLLKRFNTIGTSKGGYIEILASAPLGQRERAVLLQVGEEQILVGVAPGNVTTLHHISHPVSRSETESSLTFKEVWNFARSRQGGNE
jgi:flagellar protein FliO/FliZ